MTDLFQRMKYYFLYHYIIILYQGFFTGKHCKQNLQKCFLFILQINLLKSLILTYCDLFFSVVKSQISNFNSQILYFFIWYINRISQFIFITKHIDANVFFLFSLALIFFRNRKFNTFIIKIINHFLICFFCSFSMNF